MENNTSIKNDDVISDIKFLFLNKDERISLMLEEGAQAAITMLDLLIDYLKCENEFINAISSSESDSESLSSDDAYLADDEMQKTGFEEDFEESENQFNLLKDSANHSAIYSPYPFLLFKSPIIQQRLNADKVDVVQLDDKTIRHHL